MESPGLHRRLEIGIGLLLGVLAAAMTLSVALQSSFVGIRIFLLVPGIFVAMAAAGSMQVFSMGIAAAVNFVFYFLLCWCVGTIARRLARPQASA